MGERFTYIHVSPSLSTGWSLCKIVGDLEFSYPDFQHSTLVIPSSLPVGESGCHYWRRKNLECEEVGSERHDELVHMLSYLYSCLRQI